MAQEAFEIHQYVNATIVTNLSVVQLVEPIKYGKFDVVHDVEYFNALNGFFMVQKIEQVEVVTTIKRQRN